MEKDKKERFKKKHLPLIGAFAGYLAFILILVIILDSLILPAVIHNSEKVSAPNVIGLTLDEAENKLEESNLDYRIAAEQYNERYDDNCVINQNPKPDEVVKTGRHINLIVSKGGETVRMPYVCQRTTRYARVTLMKRGLFLGNINYVYNDSIGADTVIKQSVPSGKEIAYGSYVDIQVSKGLKAEIKVPNLIGKTIIEAEETLQKKNLQLGIVSNTYDEIYGATYMRNTIVDQFPQPGELVSQNTKIDVTTFR